VSSHEVQNVSDCQSEPITATTCDNVEFGNIASQSTLVADLNNNAGDLADEECSAVDNSQNTNIAVAVTHNDSGRTYDKKSYCYYCQIRQPKLCRHLQLKHSDEEQVQELMNSKDKEMKNIALSKIRNLGNHRHNQNVFKKREGEFVVIHRSKENTSYQDYVPCRYCFGYYVKKSVWKHNCQFAPKTSEGVKVSRIKKGAVDLISNSSGETSKTGFAGLINGMRKDIEGRVTVQDTLIMQLGQKLCTKFGGDRQQFSYIRSKMRQVACLLCCLRRTSGQGSASMSYFIEPTQFTAVVHAARQCAGFTEDGKYQAP